MCARFVCAFVKDDLIKLSNKRVYIHDYNTMLQLVLVSVCVYTEGLYFIIHSWHKRVA